jgi:preprotein translocase subunit SecE
MGKVKDGASIPATTKAGKAASGGSNKSPGWFAAFVANLTKVDRYKPLQGRRARLGTAIGLGAILILGLVQLYHHLGDYPRTTQLAVPVVVGVILGWLAYRVVEYPPFVEFLIATEAEMNKVSWTSKDELKRATIVVLVTVALMATFLFGVDFLWQFLLKAIGVIRIGDTSDFGSNA